MPENPYASDTRCLCPDDWRELFDKARCPQHGGAAYESERSKFWREGAAAKQAEIVKLLREHHGGNLSSDLTRLDANRAADLIERDTDKED